MGPLRDIEVLAFDADDTLWVNQPYFDQAVVDFQQLLAGYSDRVLIDQLLYNKQIELLELYGYGIKPLVLSMIEVANELIPKGMPKALTTNILEIGKDMLQMPIELIPHIQEALEQTAERYKLIMATKGDLVDQVRKLRCSGLADYFHHVEVMSNKKTENYRNLLRRLEVSPSNFCMVGNSYVSDVMPVLEIGAKAVYIPYHTTWKHEVYDGTLLIDGKNAFQISDMRQLGELLA